MAKNDAILSDRILDQRVEECYPSTDRGAAFEHLLKAYDFSNEELKSGWVDGRDGH